MRDFVFLLLISIKDNLLNVFPALDRNGMGHVLVLRLDQLGVQIPNRMDGKLCAALVAVKRPDDVPVAAFRARFLHPPRRHRYKEAFISFDDFDIAHDEAIIQGNGGEGPEFFVRAFFGENPDFRDFHPIT